MSDTEFIGNDAILELLRGMAQTLQRQLAERGRQDVAMIGIHTGGAWLAEHLHGLLNLASPLGTLDISFYRDDFTRIGMNPEVRPSQVPFEVDDRHIVLVDDVLHTGRTIRAALNEIFDFGRPASVTLAVLVDRGGHELPIHPDVVGFEPEMAGNGHLKLLGPDPLSLVRTADKPLRGSEESEPQ